MSPRRKDKHRVLRNEQPLNWTRALSCGFLGVTLMMSFVDTFYLMGVTTFSYEFYIGSLLVGVPYGSHAWTVGVLANWLIGSIFGLFYAAVFEYFICRATPRAGMALGLAHAALAGIALFPFFNMLHEWTGVNTYPGFGFFGVGLGFQTFALIVVSHVLFGATMGLLYGPVRQNRLQARAFEPGDTGYPGEPDVIGPDEDARDRAVL